MSAKALIPEISDTKLKKLAKRIRPVVRFAEGAEGKFPDPRGVAYYIKPVHLRNAAVTWGPKPSRKAGELRLVDTIHTYHEYGAPSLFKPSVAEVLAQIPEKHLKNIVAFEIGDADLSSSGEQHVASTRLYARA
jgi:hypothetical protein